MREAVFKLRSLVSCKFVNTLNALFAFDVTSLPDEISATCALKRSIGILEPYFAANSTLTKMYYYRPFQVYILLVKVNVKLISAICKNSSLLSNLLLSVHDRSYRKSMFEIFSAALYNFLESSWQTKKIRNWDISCFCNVSKVLASHSYACKPGQTTGSKIEFEIVHSSLFLSFV